jgi:hypothetical protein
VIDASPDNMLRFFSTSISATKRAGRAPARRQRLARRRAALYLAYRSFAFWSADAGRAREY